MVRALFHALLRGARKSETPVRPTRFAPALRPLEGRTLPAVFGLFVPGGGGTLSVFGDNLDNALMLGRDPAGKILVNGGAVTIFGGTPTVANTSSISVF